MRTCCAALGTRLSALWWPKWERNPKKRDICICITDSLCCTAETNSIVKQRCCFIRNYPTIVQSNCAILPHILISTLLFFYIFWPCGMWGLSFLPRDWTCTPALEGGVLTTGCCCCKSCQSCPTLCDPTDGSPPDHQWSPSTSILIQKVLRGNNTKFLNIIIIEKISKCTHVVKCHIF